MDGRRVSRERRPASWVPVAGIAAVEQLLNSQAEGHDGDRWRRRDVDHHLAALRRHLAAHERGELIDPDSGRPHLEHLTARALMACDVAQD